MYMVCLEKGKQLISPSAGICDIIEDYDTWKFLHTFHSSISCTELASDFSLTVVVDLIITKGPRRGERGSFVLFCLGSSCWRKKSRELVPTPCGSKEGQVSNAFHDYRLKHWCLIMMSKCLFFAWHTLFFFLNCIFTEKTFTQCWHSH